MKNAKIEYAEIILDYFILEELVNKCDTIDTLKSVLSIDYKYRDIYSYPEKMIDVENDCGAIFTIVEDKKELYLCKEIEYLDPQSEFHYQNIEDFLETLSKMLDNH